MKIYTRTGDTGQTSLVGGQRVAKTHPRLEAYGTLDELNSHVGLLVSILPSDAHRQELLAVQNDLFVVSSNLATDTSSRPLRSSSVVGDERVAALEQTIDGVVRTLPQSRLFVLPGGSQAAAQAHVCRTVCRRAERRILALADAGIAPDPQVLRYVNRLSDYFFVLARALNIETGHAEVFWSPNA